MRERGRYQIQFMKTRSSSAVGQKVELEFDIETLRIRDLPEEEQSSSGTKTSSVLDALKTRSTLSVAKDGVVTPDESAPAPKAQVTSSKLSAMLRNLEET